MHEFSSWPPKLVSYLEWQYFLQEKLVARSRTANTATVCAGREKIFSCLGRNTWSARNKAKLALRPCASSSSFGSTNLQLHIAA